MRPSDEKNPRGSWEKVSSAKAHGAPARSAWKKAHRLAGKADGGTSHENCWREKGRLSGGIGERDQGEEAATQDRWAWRILHWSGDHRQRELSAGEP